MVTTAITIVIPAYKPDFLGQALLSLSQQADPDFEVVVADDGSPANIEGICAPFRDCLHLKYQRFDSNLGASNLVAHWNRAIKCASTEWVWLMGDDDELEPGCVACVNAAIRPGSVGHDLVHLNVVTIDEYGNRGAVGHVFPQELSAREYLLGRLSGELSSFTCEYVFRREALFDVGGFVDFPHAWCSDDATWLSLAAANGIRTLDGPLVHWRLSSMNISSRDERYLPGKVEAMVLYVGWIGRFLNRHPSRNEVEPSDRELFEAALAWFHRRTLSMRAKLTLRQLWSICFRLSESSGQGVNGILLEALRVQRWVRNRRRHEGLS